MLSIFRVISPAIVVYRLLFLARFIYTAPPLLLLFAALFFSLPLKRLTLCKMLFSKYRNENNRNSTRVEFTMTVGEAAAAVTSLAKAFLVVMWSRAWVGGGLLEPFAIPSFIN